MAASRERPTRKLSVAELEDMRRQRDLDVALDEAASKIRKSRRLQQRLVKLSRGVTCLTEADLDRLGLSGAM